jgi:hypothetical protein
VGQEPHFKPVSVFVYEMPVFALNPVFYIARYRKKYVPAGAENFRARSGPQGAGVAVAKTRGSLVL